MSYFITKIEFIKLKYYFKFILIYILFSAFAFSQSSTKHDYLLYDYMFLDKDYKIIIDSATFNSLVKKHKFYPDRINKYTDSLSVVLMGELDDWSEIRKAKLQINYSWNRASLYLQKDEEFLKSLGNNLGIRHPYNFIELLKKEKVKFPELVKVLQDLKVKLVKSYKIDKQEIDSLSNRKLLKLSFNKNPKVKELKVQYILNNNMRKFEIKHKRKPTAAEILSLGTGCGKENCCQTNG